MFCSLDLAVYTYGSNHRSFVSAWANDLFRRKSSRHRIRVGSPPAGQDHHDHPSKSSRHPISPDPSLFDFGLGFAITPFGQAAWQPSQSKSSHHQIRGGPGRVHHDHPSKLSMIYRKLVVFEFGSSAHRQAVSPDGPLSIEICPSSNFTCSITLLKVLRPGPRLHHPPRSGRHRIRDFIIHRDPAIPERLRAFDPSKSSRCRT